MSQEMAAAEGRVHESELARAQRELRYGYRFSRSTSLPKPGWATDSSDRAPTHRVRNTDHARLSREAAGTIKNAK